MFFYCTAKGPQSTASFGFCCYFAGPAEDICQNVFMKLLSEDYSFEDPVHEKHGSSGQP